MLKPIATFLAGIILTVAGIAMAAPYIGFNPSTNMIGLAGGLIDYSPTQTITSSNCTITGIKGGNTAGQFTVGTTATCVITLTEPAPAPNGWTCLVADATATSFAQVLKQTSSSTTGCTLTGAINSGDTVIFVMIGY